MLVAGGSKRRRTNERAERKKKRAGLYDHIENEQTEKMLEHREGEKKKFDEGKKSQ